MSRRPRRNHSPAFVAAATMAKYEFLPTWLRAFGPRLAPYATRGGLWVALGAALVVGGTVIYYQCKDEDVESWLRNCPWGTNPFGDDKTQAWQTQPDLALADLQNLLVPVQATSSHHHSACRRGESLQQNNRNYKSSN